MAECGSGDVRLFNPTAAFIWRRLEERLSEASIARAVARDFGVEYRIAHADVAATLDAWGEAGLATFEGAPGRAAKQPAAAATLGTEEGGTRHYRLGAAPFAVRYRIAGDAGPAQRGFHERVTAMLAPLEEGGPAQGPEVELAIEGVLETAFGPFCRAIVQRLFGPFDWLFTLHAAVLARGEGAVAICAAQGAGKSTLAAWLAAHGWRYFDDDLAIVDPSGPSVLPLPVAVGVKEGSRALLEPHHPALRTAALHRYGHKAARYIAMPTAATRPALLEAIAFSRYEAGSATEMRRVAPAEAARRMMEAGIVFSPALRPAMIEWMSRLLRCTPCHEIRYSDLREAETALRSIS